MNLTDEAELKGLEGELASDEEFTGVEDSERDKGIKWKVINLRKIENPLWHIPRYSRRALY